MKFQMKINKNDMDMAEMYQKTESGTYLVAIIHTDMLEDRNLVDRLDDGKTVDVELTARG